MATEKIWNLIDWLVKHVLVKMHEQKQVVTLTDVSNYTLEKCDRIIEVLFLTKEHTIQTKVQM